MVLDVIFKPIDNAVPVKFKQINKSIPVKFSSFQIASDARVEHYKGSYDVTPLITSQVLNTNQKFMDDDVRVDMIPTKEIENAAGGITFIVGG